MIYDKLVTLDFEYEEKLKKRAFIERECFREWIE